MIGHVLTVKDKIPIGPAVGGRFQKLGVLGSDWFVFKLVQLDVCADGIGEGNRCVSVICVQDRDERPQLHMRNVDVQLCVHVVDLISFKHRFPLLRLE